MFPLMGSTGRHCLGRGLAGAGVIGAGAGDGAELGTGPPLVLLDSGATGVGVTGAVLGQLFWGTVLPPILRLMASRMGVAVLLDGAVGVTQSPRVLRGCVGCRVAVAGRTKGSSWLDCGLYGVYHVDVYEACGFLGSNGTAFVGFEYPHVSTRLSDCLAN